MIVVKVSSIELCFYINFGFAQLISLPQRHPQASGGSLEHVKRDFA